MWSSRGPECTSKDHVELLWSISFLLYFFSCAVEYFGDCSFLANMMLNCYGPLITCENETQLFTLTGQYSLNAIMVCEDGGLYVRMEDGM